MAAITKNRNFFKWPKLLYFKPPKDELFNNLFYELWNQKGGMKLKKSPPAEMILSQSQPNFAEMIGCPLSKWCPSVCPVYKMAAITKNRNFFKWPKLLYFKPESAQIWTV